MKTISISGNIGCGKSTVLEHCRTAFPGICMVQEPLEEWKLHLDAFYTDPTNNSFNLQMKICESYDRIFKHCGGSVVVERNSFESLNVFAKILHSHQQLSDDELSLLSKQSIHKPDYVIYLKTTPTTCLRRIEERDRGNETSKITLNYLNEINNAYDDLYANSPVNSVFVVDANESSTAVLVSVCAALETIGLDTD